MLTDRDGLVMEITTLQLLVGPFRDVQRQIEHLTQAVKVDTGRDFRFKLTIVVRFVLFTALFYTRCAIPLFLDWGGFSCSEFDVFVLINNDALHFY